MNREAQIATMLTVSFAFAFLGWAIVYLASAPVPVIRTRQPDARIAEVVDRRNASIAESPRMIELSGLPCRLNQSMQHRH